MESHDERIARRADERAELERQLDREEAEGQSSAAIQRQRGGKLGSAAFLAGIVLLAAALLSTCVTLIRLSGHDFAEASRTGQATVAHCTEQGPVTTRGFGYWYRCVSTIRWDDGGTDRLVIDEVFTPADIGRAVRVGDVGEHRGSRELAREDTPARPWLTWIGVTVGIIGLLPTFLVAMILRELLRFRRR
ncbi:hypothetical protein FB565_000335 [Actinoplanes lutulentus]|uniref:Uncharacterized protein n=1 Tax=Actinoplanes lutulentus TaxID=1287878 RepID=A0A327ZJD0_9ACTN|nr:DUF6346 domain-containing protein [Actinoplanes lutulentus]MBB2940631.1 hypothetical protein [Actinoplanes lutulentus]RAK42942.1 hypothetical protein B0I29_10172 [Actinoplanes lutulentus]